MTLGRLLHLLDQHLELEHRAGSLSSLNLLCFKALVTQRQVLCLLLVFPALAPSTQLEQKFGHPYKSGKRNLVTSLHQVASLWDPSRNNGGCRLRSVSSVL